MTTRNLIVAVLVTAALGGGAAVRSETAREATIVGQINDQLHQLKATQADATIRLSEANKKLTFLGWPGSRSGNGYALTDDFGPIRSS